MSPLEAGAGSAAGSGNRTQSREGELSLPDLTAPRTASRGAIEFIKVTKRFGGSVAVDALELKIPAGTYCCLLGPSGCGKTTSLQDAGRA